MWDAIYGWLKTYLATLDGLSAVYDGTPVTGDELLAYAVLGRPGEVEDEAGFYEQDYESAPLIAETGEVNVRFVSRSGDDDPAPHQAVVKGWVDALRRHIAADQTLGGLLMQSSTVRVARVDVAQQKTSGGVLAARTVTVGYFTRFREDA